MRRVLSVFAVVLLLPAAHGLAASKGKTEKRSVVSGGKSRIYYRYVPSGVTSGEINRYAWGFLSLHALTGDPKYKVYRR